MLRTDIAIIGAGPAGLFAAFYAGMRHLTTQVIDTLPNAGGQPFALYPEKKIYDIGGIPNLSGQALTTNGLAQIEPFRATTTLCFDEKVLQFSQVEDDGETYFTITTSKGTREARAILIATGGGAFSPRLLKAKGVDALPNDQLTYIAKPYASYQHKTLAILGGGDTALDYANEIAPYADHIALIHRRDRFRGLEHQVALLETHPNVERITPYIPNQIDLTADGKISLTLTKARTEDSKQLVVDEVLVAYGFIGSQTEMNDWPVTTHHQAIPVDQQMATDHPGVFAIGDIATYPHKTKLIASAYGEAPTAINSIFRYLHPDDDLHMIHSTTFFGSH
ncbi:MAG: NAD(P)/FAD-dependent oxidoreductase [Aerococcus sp.]|nr:NAD(P)/FAD-dependent oxidoreductase [Aerococcus sp.]